MRCGQFHTHTITSNRGTLRKILPPLLRALCHCLRKLGSPVGKQQDRLYTCRVFSERGGRKVKELGLSRLPDVLVLDPQPWRLWVAG